MDGCLVLVPLSPSPRVPRMPWLVFNITGLHLSFRVYSLYYLFPSSATSYQSLLQYHFVSKMPVFWISLGSSLSTNCTGARRGRAAPWKRGKLRPDAAAAAGLPDSCGRIVSISIGFFFFFFFSFSSRCFLVFV